MERRVAEGKEGGRNVGRGGTGEIKEQREVLVIVSSDNILREKERLKDREGRKEEGRSEGRKGGRERRKEESEDRRKRGKLDRRDRKRWTKVGWKDTKTKGGRKAGEEGGKR